MQDKIIIKGAREHNLKNIDIEIPRDKLVVITGLSGSGKSSLAFDTIYAEGQRRYVESLSSYAKQFLGLMEKPDVDQIDGLSPAISIDQKSTTRNPRSTVGTVTEIYDYLRLLYARVGHSHCPLCGKEVTKQTSRQIIDRILSWPDGTKIYILAPVVKDKKGEHKYVFEALKKAGYQRVRVDSKVYDIEEDLELDKKKKHNIEVMVDRMIVEPENSQRLAESIESALNLGEGVVFIQNVNTEEEQIFSQNFVCLDCGVNLPEVQPRNFSFNSPHGACTYCTGLGVKLEIDPDLVMPNKKLSLSEGAIRPWSRTTSKATWYSRMLEAIAENYGFSMDAPVTDLPKEAMRIVLYGSNGSPITIRNSKYDRIPEFETIYEGVIPNLERRHKETDSEYIRKEIEKYMAVRECPQCHGNRLKPEVLAIKVGRKSIMEVAKLSINQAIDFFNNVKLDEKEKFISHQIIKEILERLKFLLNVGLEYLTLDRAAGTLSGGEAQRIRLATQIGSSLMGVLYILDEPSIGLHQRDNIRLIGTLKRLRDLGNTVIVVEHDAETIMESDHVIDIGPGAGEHGGEVVSEGTPEDIVKDKKSLTGQYLSGSKKIALPEKRRKGNGKEITIVGAEENNLKNVTVSFPLGRFVVVSGVSGSGKSSLINDILAKKLSQVFHRAQTVPGKHKEILGTKNLDKVINIDQSPIGRTPRSNPATYTGVFTDVRELFAATPEARIRGYKQGRFSFNVKGGRCEACHGDGIIKIEMHFLPDVYITCDECKGKRYNKEALEIRYKGKNIADVLEMTIEEALAFFKNIPQIQRKLETIHEVGLGYMRLGQPATTLSGGEAQRVKLAAELSRRSTGKTLYILDEPTTGLHFDDISRLLGVLQKLVDLGNTVLVIEHNLDVIKSADWVIDIGPEGGEAGGQIIATGTPEQVSKVDKSYTGQYLKNLLGF
ncbi:excinuclease ABC subunit A [bacterium CG2_30_37_16]|nr:MAG: excinuclease ABC subunit A [bacterium CG2_30_37_16]PIX99350.1 MAG: excinuclease ABC subunit UvrA [bacterium (Candidatus Howlettbacteria) CG_4_10_14_3_um_filter_37_10]PJB06112.1 MAG: excinuclease ABC subunit UvrA [bacterium (Candidatus Howlettbacteria) CG_4_9_14_3_um_filter_37_10]